MFLTTTYWMWTSGTYEVNLTVGLDPSRRYLVDGGLVGRSGSGFGQVFISTLCQKSASDVVSCGVREDGSESPDSDITSLGLLEVVDHAVSVTLSLRGDGGLNRAEGAVWDIT